MNNLTTNKNEIVHKLLGFIESIEERDGCLYVNTNKDLFIQSSGNLVIMNKGLQVFLAKQTHLNPNISHIDDIKTIENDIRESILDKEY